jgi:hypothetical protein
MNKYFMGSSTENILRSTALTNKNLYQHHCQKFTLLILKALNATLKLKTIFLKTYVFGAEQLSDPIMTAASTQTNPVFVSYAESYCTVFSESRKL